MFYIVYNVRKSILCPADASCHNMWAFYCFLFSVCLSEGFKIWGISILCKRKNIFCAVHKMSKHCHLEWILGLQIELSPLSLKCIALTEGNVITWIHMHYMDSYAWSKSCLGNTILLPLWLCHWSLVNRKTFPSHVIPASLFQEKYPNNIKGCLTFSCSVRMGGEPIQSKPMLWT